MYFQSLPDLKGAWRALQAGGAAATVYRNDFFGVAKNSYSFVASGGLSSTGAAACARSKAFKGAGIIATTGAAAVARSYGALASGGGQFSAGAKFSRGRGAPIPVGGCQFGLGAKYARGRGIPAPVGGFVAFGQGEVVFVPGAAEYVFLGLGGRLIVLAEARCVEIESESRALVVAAESRRFCIESDMAIGKDSRGKFSVFKDPAANLDYEFDWSKWLVNGDTIASFVVTAAGGVVCGGSGQVSGVVSVMVSGGTADTEASITCRVTTVAGRVDERTLFLSIRQR